MQSKTLWNRHTNSENPKENKQNRAERLNSAESEEVMKEYKVSYMLGSMYHSFIETAENESRAIQKVLNRLPDGSKEIMHEFKIERYFQEWN